MTEKFTLPKDNHPYFRTKPQVIVFVFMAVSTYFKSYECMSQFAIVWVPLFTVKGIHLQCR